MVMELKTKNGGQVPPTWRAKCRSGFVTLPPVLLPGAVRCGSFVGKGFGLLVVSYG
jgi:hypothetical protein